MRSSGCMQQQHEPNEDESYGCRIRLGKHSPKCANHRGPNSNTPTYAQDDILQD